jgi:hypothetical protein
MPFKSEAQRRKFYALKAEGKMSQREIDKWEKETPDNLPERVKAKNKAKKRLNSSN